MSNNLLASVLLSCFTFSVNATELPKYANEIIESIERGSIEISDAKTVKISSEILELIIQINNSDLFFDKPILKFIGNEIYINDEKMLNEVLAKSHATMTSL